MRVCRVVCGVFGPLGYGVAEENCEDFVFAKGPPASVFIPGYYNHPLA